ncbi:MAG: class I SAM-dependent methyltransferase [Candidatus Methylomirabilis sp.]|nr:class I SAM-dependent methyltransferase [Candidatus Methylomirabilis sp.]
MRRINGEISEFVSGGTLLDVGCGRGEFLFGMSKYRQWTLRGLEMNPSLAQFVTEMFYVPVLTGRLDQVLPGSVTYDVITLWDVFEHLSDPDDALGRLKESLSRDGLLIIKMPNPESLGASLFGACWSGWGVPQHYFTWPPNVFEAFVQKRGLRIVRGRYLYGAYSDFITSVSFALHGIFRERVRKLLTRVLSLPPFMIGLSPFMALERALGRPSSVTYFIQHAE